MTLQTEDHASFFESVLEASSERPLKALEAICRAWRRFSQAHWAWLWLFNEYRQHFELFAVSPGAPRPDRFITPGKDSASYYTLKRKKGLEHVSNVMTWKPTGADVEGSDPRVVYAKILRGMDSDCYDSVPLIDYDGFELGVLTLHYHEGQRGIENGNWIDLMIRLSARAINQAFRTENLHTLSLLNKHTTDALGHPYRPEHARARYTTDLIQLIHERTNAEAVTVFFRSPMDPNTFECVASTGLREASTGESIDPANFSLARYRLNQGRTGKCISENRPMFIEGADSEPTYIDRDRFQQDVRRGPVLLYPIPSPTGASPAAGVIRCSQHRPLNFPQELRSFDHMEIQALDFIAKQAAVVLGVCATRIRREQLMSATNHDLKTSLSMIVNEVEELQKLDDLRGEEGQKAVANLEYNSLLARNVAEQLEISESDTELASRSIPKEGMMLNEPIEKLTRILAHKAKFHGLGVELQLNGLATCRANRVLFERAFTNLLLNAIQNAKETSTIIVVLKREALGDLVIGISNQGSIPVDIRSNLFEFGGPSHRERGGPGGGVGLWSAKQALRGFGANVELDEAAEPETVRFVIRFPAEIVENWEVVSNG